MTTQDKTYFNWSGGKDSALTLYHAQQMGLAPDLLITSVNASFDRISMHGVRRGLLQRQAQCIGLPLETIDVPEDLTIPLYNDIMSRTVSGLRERGYTDTVFGDIFLEDLRAYREEQLRPYGITAHFPFGKKYERVAQEFLDLGFKTILVCIKSELLDRSFAGRVIDSDFIKDLPANVDPCGENGEFHTFVYDGPIFREPVQFDKGEIVYREYARPKDDPQPEGQMGFWFCDLVAASVSHKVHEEH